MLAKKKNKKTGGLLKISGGKEHSVVKRSADLAAHRGCNILS